MPKLTDAEALKIATRQARARWRKAGIPRTYPELRPFMTTAQYVREYEVLNGPAALKPLAIAPAVDRVAPKLVGPEVVEEIDDASLYG